MNRNPDSFTPEEQRLMERFVQYDENALSCATQSILNEYRDIVFVQDIFSIVVEDVLTSLSINEWNMTSFQKIVLTAQQIWKITGCCYFPGEHLPFAISLIWITSCCRYKGIDNILSSHIESPSLIRDSKHLQYSMCADFFNFFGGPTVGKSKKLQRYMFKTYGELHRNFPKENNNHITNFYSLLYFLQITNFSYKSPQDITILKSVGS